MQFFVIIFPGYSVSISAVSTATPCYGDTVTLVCDHPELATNPSQYKWLLAFWFKNGVHFNPGERSDIYTTSRNNQHTNLTINIAIGYFGGKAFNYSCVLDQNDGTLIMSENIAIVPLGECKIDFFAV